MRKIICLILILVSIASVCFAEEDCKVCLYTPQEIHELHTGKGGSLNGEGYSEKLSKPIFTGKLFYSLDESDKQDLPSGKGVFFRIKDGKKHKITILSKSGKSWGSVRFNCSEYKYGIKIFFEKSGFYSPGWKTYPMPKDEKKCPWHPER